MVESVGRQKDSCLIVTPILVFGLLWFLVSSTKHSELLTAYLIIYEVQHACLKDNEINSQKEAKFPQVRNILPLSSQTSVIELR
jgi:hypothetical protein